MDSGKKRLKREFLIDYTRKLYELFLYLKPLLEQGWTENEVYDLVLFIEKNQARVKGKKIQEILIEYKNHLKGAGGKKK